MTEFVRLLFCLKICRGLFVWNVKQEDNGQTPMLLFSQCDYESTKLIKQDIVPINLRLPLTSN